MRGDGDGAFFPEDLVTRRQVSDPSVPDVRVPTGSPELDRMLDGGLLAGRPYLIVGPPGTGKTTLALQFLCEGVRQGERSLYVTLEDPPNEVRADHRGLNPYLDQIEVFDAIPDVMRYEHIPFKDISSVRAVVPFSDVPGAIRQTPEFTSVEVTITALEQLLRSHVQRRHYKRIVIDSLTALQYFCMKGYDLVLGGQTFLRFLSDLGTTAVITAESPIEDAETPERLLARGELRLFRWELDGATVRAIGVEKFRGSSHDVRLHPYRIGPEGLRINLHVTISRDTHEVIEPVTRVTQPSPELPGGTAVAALGPLGQELQDLVTLKTDVAPLRSEIEAALRAVRGRRPEQINLLVARAMARAESLARRAVASAPPPDTLGPEAQAALYRLAARTERGPAVPTSAPPGSQEALERQLERLLPGTAPAQRPSPETPVVPGEAPSPPPVPAEGRSPLSRSTRGGSELPPAGVPPSPLAPAGSPPPPGPSASERSTQVTEGGAVREEPRWTPRPAPALLTSERPPLPVHRVPAAEVPGPTRAAPRSRSRARPRAVETVPSEVATVAAASATPKVRRRRRTTAGAPSGPGPEVPAPPDGSASLSMPGPKRRRAPRKRKAPTVVAASDATVAAPPPPPGPAPAAAPAVSNTTDPTAPAPRGAPEGS